jgi:hypothetical protein
MQDPMLMLVSAIERANAIGQEGRVDSWRTIEACQGEIKKATKALRAVIALTPDEETRQEYQRLLASAKRLHDALVRAKAAAVARTIRDN